MLIKSRNFRKGSVSAWSPGDLATGDEVAIRPQAVGRDRLLLEGSFARRSFRQVMAYAPKIVLHCPYGYRLELDALVEQFLIDGVKFVGVVGTDCALIEDLIDEIVVGDGKEPDRFILTSARPGESIDDVLEFARQLTDLDEGDAQIVALDMRPPRQ